MQSLQTKNNMVSDYQPCQVSYWFSLTYAHYASDSRCKTVNVYKMIDGTEFNSTHITTNGTKPRIYDIQLVAEGNAECVRSFRPPLFTYYRNKKPIFTVADQVGCCAICLEDTGIDAGACQLRCKHHFCRSCIVEWYFQNDTCPCCRAEIERFDADVDVKKEVRVRRIDVDVEMKRMDAEIEAKMLGY